MAMIDLGKGVSVDFIDKPYVFGIEGCDPIRVQKGEGRITGVSLDQLDLIVKTIRKAREAKDAVVNNNGHVEQDSATKTGSAGGAGSAARKGNRSKSR